jgi:hypothetical protein
MSLLLEVFKIDAKNPLTIAVLGDRHQICQILKSRLSSQIIGQIFGFQFLYRSDENDALIERIPTANLDPSVLPDANARGDFTAFYAWPEVLAEDHIVLGSLTKTRGTQCCGSSSLEFVLYAVLRRVMMNLSEFLRFLRVLKPFDG